MDQIAHHHSMPLVCLSIAIAVVTAFAALELGKTLGSPFISNKKMWVWASGLTMGVGIWSMHFIGMLAFNLPGVEIRYHVPTVITSIVCAVLACSLGFSILAKKKFGKLSLTIVSCAMGGGISSMHYIGMEAMILPFDIYYDEFYVLAAIIIAVIASYVSLLCFIEVEQMEQSTRSLVVKVLAAFLLGGAVSSMHYIGMLGLHFEPTGRVLNLMYTVSIDHLAVVISIFTFAVILLTILGSEFEKMMYRKDLISKGLLKAIEEKDDFFSIASHELRTPITSLKLQYQLIMKDLEQGRLEPVRLEKMLSKSDESLNRITDLINNLLDTVQMNKMDFALNVSEVDLQKVIEDAFDSVEEYAARNGNTFKIVNPISIIGHWDRFRLEQVFTNIFVNAIKYAPAAAIEVEFAQDERNVIIMVRDYGDGISADESRSLFQKYRRGKSTSSQPGLGLGLYLVHHIVKQHQGTIEHDPRFKKGTQFIIKLPSVVGENRFPLFRMS